MKTLTVSYLPRKPRSHTLKLLNKFVGLLPPSVEIEALDLISAPPPTFDEKTLPLYIKRSYLGGKLGETEIESLASFDQLTAQFKSADIIVMAFPMHNFSFPGVVKSYFDAIMLKGDTFTTDQSGSTGLMSGKRALTLSASGGAYLSPPNPWNHLTSLAELEFGFMGFDEVRTVLAEAMNMGEDLQKNSLERCYAEIREIVNAWYNPE